MARNIVIYSDGTGQRGGVTFDETRSNIYKLYRATRCGPDSCIDPAEQLAFYDPGLGTLPPESNFGTLGALWRRFYNLASQATGLGLTGNIIDCYAAIVRMWEPGDRIFLFGFSRGAYTVRCLGGVLSLCGVPTQGVDGHSRHTKSGSLEIASEAVKKVYQHTESRKLQKCNERQKEMLVQRRELARRFRAKFASEDPHTPDAPNAYPHFIGVFDTVASLANPVATAILVGISVLALAVASLGLAGFFAWLGVGAYWPSVPLAFFLLVIGAGVSGLVIHTFKRIRWERGLPHSRVFHLTDARMNFYDIELNPNVAFARHAISIDETRESFQRVAWDPGAVQKSSSLEWFEQIWFAGNHSDIGGSYDENESRLSDIALKWMLDAATAAGLKSDASVIRLNPASAGMQHDEALASRVFRLAKKKPRTIPKNAPLHPSVTARFALDRVVIYDRLAPYRPANLRDHQDVRHLY